MVAEHDRRGSEETELANARLPRLRITQKLMARDLWCMTATSWVMSALRR